MVANNEGTLLSIAGRTAALAASLMLCACSDGTGSRHPSSSAGAPNDEQSAGSTAIALTIPRQISEVRAIDPAALFADVTINGESTRYTQATPISLSLSVPRDERIDIELIWYETFSPGSGSAPVDLPLASASLSANVTANTSYVIGSEQYADSLDSFDNDNDDFPNLYERRAGSNPLDPDQTPDNLDGQPNDLFPDANVLIPYIDPSERPRIDGDYDSVWNKAVFFDTDNDRLAIDNLMIDFGISETRQDGNTEMEWFALHDATNLYVFILGENVSTSIPTRDSADAWQDDSADIYIDGDNSKNSSYDGINDFHMIVPLQTSPENPQSNTSVVTQGFYSADLGDVRIATCLCGDGRHTWEFELPLADFDIDVARLFGFDVHINIDNDGGDRDEKWGWFHPSRISVNSDNTWFDPSYMGTAVLLPIPSN